MEPIEVGPNRRHTDRWFARGYTRTGRKLGVSYVLRDEVTAIVITAFEVESIMSKKRSTTRTFTAEDRSIFARAKAEDAAELDALKAEARQTFARHQRLRDVLAALKQAREQRGLSLGDVAAVTGIAKGNLSRLENDPAANPTLETLLRLADAIGVDLTLDVVRRDAA
jgi:DNA-binding Xre family transcriptional regulator